MGEEVLCSSCNTGNWAVDLRAAVENGRTPTCEGCGADLSGEVPG